MIIIRIIFLLLASLIGYLGINLGSPIIGALGGLAIGGGVIGVEFLLQRTEPKIILILCLWLIIGLVLANGAYLFIKNPLFLIGICVSGGYLWATLIYERYLVIRLFKKREAGKKLLDTSIIIDGRIIEVIRVGFLEGEFILPRFVLEELQTIADSPDSLKRNRGRRGFEILKLLKKETRIDVEENPIQEVKEVDRKLIILAKKIGAGILTCDYNLGKVAQIEGISVLNINELVSALKSTIVPGETFTIQIVKEGKDFGQGLGYLEDGTMVIVENGSEHLGKRIKAEVLNILQSPSGRMIFSKVAR